MMLSDSCFEFHIFGRGRNAARAIPILAIMSASDSPCLLMMFPRNVKVSTSSRAFPSLSAALTGLLPVTSPCKKGGLAMDSEPHPVENHLAEKTLTKINTLKYRHQMALKFLNEY